MSRPLIAAIVILAGLLGWQTIRLSNERADHAHTKQQHAEVLAELATKTAATVTAVRRLESAYNAESAAAADAYQKDKTYALAKKDAVIAGLRADNLQLHRWWNPKPAACPGDAASPAAASRAVEDAELRAAGAGDLVRIGAHADGWIRWLQAELISTRKLCRMAP